MRWRLYLLPLHVLMADRIRMKISTLVDNVLTQEIEYFLYQEYGPLGNFSAFTQAEPRAAVRC